MKSGSTGTTRADGGDSAAKSRSAAIAYFERSRRLSVSFLAIAPLLALYEIGLAVTDAPIANGAELLLRRIFLVAGPRYGPMLWRLALLGAFAAAAYVVIRESIPILRDLPRIALEGLAYGAFLGPFALWLQRRLVSFLAVPGTQHGVLLDAALACGAGVYEEILFRLLVLSAIYYVVRQATGTGAAHQVAAGIVAVVVSALLFSAFHHWPGGEPFEWGPFVFRSIAGCTLGALFLARGLGIAVYTHAAYDLLVTFWH